MAVRLAFSALALCLLAGCGRSIVPDRPHPTPMSAPVSALDVLHAWDSDRASAWESSDPAALGRLYLPGSVAGRRDVTLLADYLRRGLRVHGMQMQVLSARVVLDEATVLRLEVTDRLGPTSVGSSSGWQLLPADRASRRMVELRRYQGRWVVAAVHDS
ncbi:MAG TPA: hypothetical protein VFE15_01290 [Marmoricola sp.]|jgi:hypothetical protein|nr:hypothetical protein [Marmoricola sp.]